jgi:hypothetical protein
MSTENYNIKDGIIGNDGVIVFDKPTSISDMLRIVYIHNQNKENLRLKEKVDRKLNTSQKILLEQKYPELINPVESYVRDYPIWALRNIKLLKCRLHWSGVLILPEHNDYIDKSRKSYIRLSNRCKYYGFDQIKESRLTYHYTDFKVVDKNEYDDPLEKNYHIRKTKSFSSKYKLDRKYYENMKQKLTREKNKQKRKIPGDYEPFDDGYDSDYNYDSNYPLSPNL